MKAKLIAGTLAMMLFFSLASAQDYCIRANRRINLRETASLQGKVVETVASGATLSVIGEYNRWLNINRNGGEAWMANWVDYSRVDNCGAASSPQGTPSGNANIDNCCFVDRQCSSDQDWMNGYWAFQNGQCAAQAGSGAPASSQPVSGATDQVDNCCFVDRHCQTDADWLSGYWAFQNNQCPAQSRPSASTPSRPQIEGSARFVRVVTRSLNLLRDKAPEWYSYVISAMDTIAEIPNSQLDDGFCSAFALVASRRVEIETCFPHLDDTFWSAPIKLAGTLTHEACHIHTYEAGTVYPYGLAQEEFECSIPNIAVLKALDPYGRAVNLITDLEGVLRLANHFCQLGDELSCQQAEIAHLYYE